MNYGITHKSEIRQLARKVVSVFGGGINAEDFLVEIAAAETLSAAYVDPTPETSGVGLTQFDPIALDDLKLRVRPKYRKRLKEMLGYDLDKVQLKDLANDPLLALALTRLKLMLIPDPIPATLQGRAQYWKTHYNTRLGKGTVEGYLDKVAHHG